MLTIADRLPASLRGDYADGSEGWQSARLALKEDWVVADAELACENVNNEETADQPKQDPHETLEQLLVDLTLKASSDLATY